MILLKPRCCLSFSQRSKLIRFAHTTPNNELDHEVISLIKSYPVHTNPTPYEILNISYHSFDERTLKANFNKFAKIYHPDIKHQHPLLVDKNEKFQKILCAYKLLKDPRQKMMYDEYKIGWGSNSLILQNQYQNANAFRAAPNFKEYQYYSAGTWEDFQRMKNGSPSDTLTLEQNKWQILAGVILVMIIAAAIEIVSIKELLDKEINVRSQLTDKSNKDLQKLYENYGMGNDKNSRINRFLWWRQISEILFNQF